MTQETATATEAPEGLKGQDISDEEWREYSFAGRTHTIWNPKDLFVGTTTHRVLDGEGIVHCVPVPGRHGCVLRWKPRDPSNPVAF